MKGLKRVGAAALCLLMLLSLIPTAALAVETVTVNIYENGFTATTAPVMCKAADESAKVNANADGSYTLEKGTSYKYTAGTGFYCARFTFTADKSGVYGVEPCKSFMSDDSVYAFCGNDEGYAISPVAGFDTEHAAVKGVTRAKPGQSVKLFIIANPGYVVKDFSAVKTGDTATKVTVTETAPAPTAKDNTSFLYAFSMPSHDVTVSANINETAYDLTAMAAAFGGKVTLEEGGAAVTSAKIGETVTIRPVPEEGYALYQLKVQAFGTNANITPVQKSDGTFEFEMPDHPVKVTPTFAIAGGTHLTAPADAKEITAGSTISEGGVYKITPGATGIITIATTKPVTIVGTGIAFEERYQNLGIICTQAGADLTLKDIYIRNISATYTVDFTGKGNKLQFEGVCLIDHEVSMSKNAGIHVNANTSLTVGGRGVLFFYKSAQGAGFGGNTGELNGDITFENLTMFAKGSKQGALIGAGSGADSAEGTPGSVTFNSGIYNLVSNSRGAAIGGSAGAKASSGTTVYVKGGSININVDYSGSAVGGGGYSEGNDASGGTIYISGGSLRTYVDKNAANNTLGYGGKPLTEGINDAAITAGRLNNSTDKEKVYRCILDTDEMDHDADVFTVKQGDTTLFEGGLHNYCFINEAADKLTQTNVSSTTANWLYNDDSCLYLYLTGEDHVLDVNGEHFKAVWNSEEENFTLVKSYCVSFDISNGKVYVDGAVTDKTTVAVAAPTLTFTPKADTGLDVIDVSCTPNTSSVSVVKNPNGSFTVLGISQDTIVTIKTGNTINGGSQGDQTPASAGMGNFTLSNAAFPYTDFTAAAGWDRDAAYSAYRLGLMKGVDSGTFGGALEYNVASALMTAARVHSIYNGGTGVIPQPADCWYAGAVDYCIANGIIARGDFDSYERAVTRGEMAYIFANALPSAEYQKISSLTPSDVKSTDKYAKQINLLYAAGVLVGNDDSGTFNSTGTILRREAAAIISRAAVPALRIAGK